jgi:hypothetical protein
MSWGGRWSGGGGGCQEGDREGQAGLFLFIFIRFARHGQWSCPLIALPNGVWEREAGDLDRPTGFIVVDVGMRRFDACQTVQD